jgi:hypothetical protein
MTAKFKSGRILITPAALKTFPREFFAICLNRHFSGDWGDLEQEDKDANDEALKNGSRIFSAFEDSMGERLWVITEADRSATTLLLPEDY